MTNPNLAPPTAKLGLLTLVLALLLAACASPSETPTPVAAQDIETIPQAEEATAPPQETPAPTPDIDATVEARVAATSTLTDASTPIPASTPTPTPSPTPTPPPDRAALIKLYEATGGANWKDNDNWLTGAPINDWYGVNADRNGRVTRLSTPGS